MKLNPKNIKLGKSNIDVNLEDFPNFTFKLPESKQEKIKIINVKKKDSSMGLF